MNPNQTLEQRDALYEQAMAQASDVFLRLLRGQKVPRHHYPRFTPTQAKDWHPRSDTIHQQRNDAQLEWLQAERQRVEGLKVSRDPCPMCGTRGDVGCKHRSRA